MTDFKTEMLKYRRENISIGHINTWTNEYGDRIIAECTRPGCGSTYTAKNENTAKYEKFSTLLSAKKYLNSIRKAKTWSESFE